jgi:hypothetical protein
MSLAPYQGSLLIPGMGAPTFSAEHDLMGLIYGPPHLCLYVTHALIDGAARDVGNTGNTTVLRPGLVMARLTATQKWTTYVTGGSDGSELPLGILCELGLNTQMSGGNADRFLATIMVKGNVNPEAMCIGANATYGIDKVTASHIDIRESFALNFMFSDDFQNLTAWPLAAR